MSWWNGKFSRYEVHFVYIDRNGGKGLFWVHQPRHDSKRSSSFAASNARLKSKEYKLHVRVMDAEKSQCVAMYFDGKKLEFTSWGEPLLST